MKNSPYKLVPIFFSIVVVISFFLPWVGSNASGSFLAEVSIKSFKLSSKNEEALLINIIVLLFFVSPIFFNALNLFALIIDSKFKTKLIFSLTPMIIWVSIFIYTSIKTNRTILPIDENMFNIGFYGTLAGMLLGIISIFYLRGEEEKKLFYISPKVGFTIILFGLLLTIGTFIPKQIASDNLKEVNNKLTELKTKSKYLFEKRMWTPLRDNFSWTILNIENRQYKKLEDEYNIQKKDSEKLVQRFEAYPIIGFTILILGIFLIFNSKKTKATLKIYILFLPFIIIHCGEKTSKIMYDSNDLFIKNNIKRMQISNHNYNNGVLDEYGFISTNQEYDRVLSILKRFDYNRRGEVMFAEISIFNKNGRPDEKYSINQNMDGNSRFEFTYDESNNLTSIKSYNLKSNIPYSVSNYFYDENGNNYKNTIAANNLKITYLYKFDSYNNIIEFKSLNEKNEQMNFTEQKLKYNSDGNIIETTVYNNSKPTERIKNIYNKNGLVMETILYKNPKDLNSITGKTKTKYNVKNLVSEIIYFHNQKDWDEPSSLLKYNYEYE